jgi:hypothetical protein
LGWQPIVVAALFTLLPGTIAVMLQWANRNRRPVSYSLLFVSVLLPTWLGWCWIGPLAQGLFFSEKRLLLFVIGCMAWSIVLAAGLRLIARGRPNERKEPS